MLRIIACFLVLLGGCAAPRLAPPPPIRAADVADPKWKPFADYLNSVIQKIDARWERDLLDSKVYPPIGSSVTVAFVLDMQGKVARIKEVKNESSKAAMAACIRAITASAPYGVWTADMRAALGDEQEMTFTFTYRE